MKEIWNNDNHISSLFKKLPRKKVVFAQKETVWLKIQKQIRKNRVLQDSPGFLKGAFLTKFRLKTAAIAVMVLIAVSVVGGAANATPGEALYSVKRATEQVEKVLALSENAKVKVEIKHAKRRLEEVKILVTEKKQSEIVTKTLQDLAENTQKAAAVTAQNPNLTGAIVDLANHEEDVLAGVHEIADAEVQAAIQKTLMATKETVSKLAPEETVQGISKEDQNGLGDAFPDQNASTTPTTTISEDVTAKKPTVKPKSNDGAVESGIQIDVITRIGEEESETEEPTILTEPTLDF